MEEIFKMILVRNAEVVRDEDVVTMPDDTDLQQTLIAIEGEDAREQIMSRLEMFSKSQSFADVMSESGSVKRLLQLRDSVTKLPASDAIGAVLARHLGEDYQKHVKSPSWQKEKQQLADSLITIKLLASITREPLNNIAVAMQTAHFVERWVDDMPDIVTAESISKLLSAPLQMSILKRLKLRPTPKQTETPPPIARPGQAELEELGGQVAKIDDTVNELTRLPPRLFRAQSKDDTNTPQFLINDNQRGGIFARMFNSNIQRQVITMGAAGQSKMSLSDEGIQSLSNETLSILVEKGYDLKRDSVSLVVAGLDVIKAGLIRKIKPNAGSIPFDLGGALGVGHLGFGDRFYWISPWFPLPLGETDPIPTTYGTVQPIGEAELLVVRQHIVRYEAGEIAHIENILQGEDKNRTHRRRDLTEEIFVDEIETEREEERDLETTERFKLSREASETIKEEFEVEGGLKVKITPSPAVIIEANAKVAYSNARESSRRKASEYAREIVEKSVNRLSERIRKQETLRTVREIEEINEHGIDNKDGDDHVVGVYQWVDKIYEAQVFRYGARTMYDFVLSEPAAFLIDALESDVVAEKGIIKPELFKLNAGELTEKDYLFYANKYNATGIEAPPRLEQIRSVSFSSSGGDSESSIPNLAQKENITIPEGYEAVQAHITVGFSGSQLFVSVGQHAVLYEFISGNRSFNLDLEKGTLPVTMLASGTPLFAISIEVVCRRTERAMLNWQIQTHGEIKQAYLNELSKYEEAMAQAAINRGVIIKGKNPGINRDLEATELKKHCISILTQQHYDLFNGVEVGEHGIAQLNLDVTEKQGDYIRFFEHAFEWHLISFVLYPYFWGRKQTWVDRIRYEDNDPEFAEFIKAGAARVLLPVREGFELAVIHFMDTGEVWQGGPLPEVSDPDYLPIIQEIQDRTGAPGNEVPEGAPWPVRIPTRLIKLRADGSLPSWSKNEDGEWLPDDLEEDSVLDPVS